MDDLNAIQITLGIGGVAIGLPFLVFRTMKTLKDLWPSLTGAAAIRVVYLIAAIIATVIMTALASYDGVDWEDPAAVATLVITWFVLTTGIAETAKGYYADLFKQSVPGLPPTSGETVVSVTSVPTDVLEQR